MPMKDGLDLSKRMGVLAVVLYPVSPEDRLVLALSVARVHHLWCRLNLPASVHGNNLATY